jgi:hypothetical protein
MAQELKEPVTAVLRGDGSGEDGVLRGTEQRGGGGSPHGRIRCGEEGHVERERDGRRERRRRRRRNCLTAQRWRRWRGRGIPAAQVEEAEGADTFVGT